MGKKNIFIIMILLLVILPLASQPLYARAVNVIDNGQIMLVPGTKADATGFFTDSYINRFDGTVYKDGLPATVTQGVVDPMGFKIHDDAVAGSTVLTVKGSDPNVPGYTPGSKVARDRTGSSTPGTYTDKPLGFSISASFSLNTINDTPPPITGEVNQIGFDLKMLPIIQVDLKFLTGTDYVGNYAPAKYPLSGYHFVVKKGATVVEEGNTGSASFQLNKTKYTGDTAYMLKAYAYNNFTTGHSGSYDPKWSPDIPFRTVPGGAGQPVIFTFNIKQWDKDKLVVNDIASPRPMKAADLEKAMNTAAGQATTIAIGKWLPNLNTSAAYFPGMEGQPDKNFDILPGEGVQVFTLSSFVLTLESESK